MLVSPARTSSGATGIVVVWALIAAAARSAEGSISGST
jgi:hypothetical protein